MHARIDIPREKIRAFCERRKIKELSLFGSILRDNFHSDSDVDVLVTFADDSDHSLFDRMDMIEELKQIFGRNVDMVIEKNLKNPFRRQAILSTKEPVYAA